MTSKVYNIFREVPERLQNGVNPYVKKLVVGQTEQTLPLLYGPNLTDKKGQWRNYFAQKNQTHFDEKTKIILEIGIYTGKSFLEMTQTLPDQLFIGMDITFKRVVVTAEKLKLQGLTNGVALLGNARQCHEIFAPGELDGVILFFPDPWSKKAHHLKNRLVDVSFSSMISSLLKKDGFFWFKTDQEDYFNQALESFDRKEFVLNPEGPLQRFSRNFESTFESTFLSKGLNTWESFWIKAP